MGQGVKGKCACCESLFPQARGAHLAMEGCFPKKQQSCETTGLGSSGKHSHAVPLRAGSSVLVLPKNSSCVSPSQLDPVPRQTVPLQCWGCGHFPSGELAEGLQSPGESKRERVRAGLNSAPKSPLPPNNWWQSGQCGEEKSQPPMKVGVGGSREHWNQALERRGSTGAGGEREMLLPFPGRDTLVTLHLALSTGKAL